MELDRIIEFFLLINILKRLSGSASGTCKCETTLHYACPCVNPNNLFNIGIDTVESVYDLGVIVEEISEVENLDVRTEVVGYESS